MDEIPKLAEIMALIDVRFIASVVAGSEILIRNVKYPFIESHKKWVVLGIGTILAGVFMGVKWNELKGGDAILNYGTILLVNYAIATSCYELILKKAISVLMPNKKLETPATPPILPGA